jgi:TldD protein
MVRMSNLFIEPGQEDPAALLRAVPAGLFVKKMGGGEVDPLTGAFVFEVTEGYWIKNGALQKPIKGATLAGSARDVLRQDLRLGNSAHFTPGICSKNDQDVPVSDAQPSLLIPELIVGGKKSSRSAA